MSTQLPANNPTAYLGVESTYPGQIHLKRRAPINAQDVRNYVLGDTWIDLNTNGIWQLTNLVNLPGGGKAAVWTTTSGAGVAGVTNLQGDVGLPVGPIAGLCLVTGDAAQGVSTQGFIATGEIKTTVQDASTVAKGVSQYNAAQFTTLAGVVSIVNASTAVKGIAQFDPTYFSTAVGVVSLANISSFQWLAAIAAQPITPNRGYYTTLPGLTTFTLPLVAAAGSIIKIQGGSAGGWQINQNAVPAQQIIFDNLNATTAGAAGYIASIDPYGGIDLLCITANTTWVATSIKGNLTKV